MTEIKDSGERAKFETGAQRDTTKGKGRFDLLPPTALTRVAQIFQGGAEKYDARNWEKGIPLSRYVDSGMRHLLKYLEGREDEDHLAQAAWNLLCALHTEEMIKRGRLPLSLADLPSYAPVPVYTTDATKDCSQWRQPTTSTKS